MTVSLNSKAVAASRTSVYSQRFLLFDLCRAAEREREQPALFEPPLATVALSVNVRRSQYGRLSAAEKAHL